MSRPYIFLTCLISRPRNTKNGIDVYLQPLIDDLKKLWNGVETYDISRKNNFMMRATLMWTINDFPTYDMLSGWGTQGKLACPYCMEDTKAFRLNNERKNSWFDSLHRFLPNDHTFRRNKSAFKKGKVEMGGSPSMLISEQIWHVIKDLTKVIDNPHVGKCRKIIKIWGMT